MEEDAKGMDVVQACHQVDAKVSNGAFWQMMILGKNVCKTATGTQLHHQPQVVAGLIPFMELYHIGVTDVMGHSHLDIDNGHIKFKSSI